MEFVVRLVQTGVSTSFDVAPIIAILVLFQVAVLRRKVPNLQRIVTGFVYVLLGLTLFLVGLEEALVPIGETMARQLTAQALAGPAAASVQWGDYLMVYAFAFAIGFTATVAEPSLIAVALKAEEVSGGAVGAQGLRLAVALGSRRRCRSGLLPHRHGHAAAVVHRRRLRRGHRADVPFQPNHHPAGVRQRRRHHIHGDGSGIGRPGPRARGLGSRAQSADRRIRPDCVCQRFSHHVRTGLRPGRFSNLAPSRRQPGPQKEIPAMQMKLIVVLAPDDKTDTIIDAARARGATGATVITSVRGEGLTPEKTFLGLEVTAMRDVLLFLVVEERAREILEQIRDAGRFDQEPGAGVAFQIAIEDVVGLGTQLPTMLKEVEDEL